MLMKAQGGEPNGCLLGGLFIGDTTFFTAQGRGHECTVIVVISYFDH